MSLFIQGLPANFKFSYHEFMVVGLTVWVDVALHVVRTAIVAVAAHSGFVNLFKYPQDSPQATVAFASDVKTIILVVLIVFGVPLLVLHRCWSGHPQAQYMKAQYFQRWHMFGLAVACCISPWTIYAVPSLWRSVKHMSTKCSVSAAVVIDHVLSGVYVGMEFYPHTTATLFGYTGIWQDGPDTDCLVDVEGICSQSGGDLLPASCYPRGVAGIFLALWGGTLVRDACCVT